MTVVRPHRWMVPSKDADASALPSSENATSRTGSEWPMRVAVQIPVVRFHTGTVLSTDANARTLLSEENATFWTRLGGP